MQLKELFSAQEELDQRIIEGHKLQGKDLFSNKVLAFIVEVGELANELRFFKYWSNKGPSEPSVVLEEFSDCMHFILSIGNELNNQCEGIIHEHNYKMNLNYGHLTEDFLKIIDLVSSLNNIRVESRGVYGLKMKTKMINIYIEAFERFLMLGYKLGFTWKDIEHGYYSKHAKNFKRQDQGY